MQYKNIILIIKVLKMFYYAILSVIFPFPKFDQKICLLTSNPVEVVRSKNFRKLIGQMHKDVKQKRTKKV